MTNSTQETTPKNARARGILPLPLQGQRLQRQRKSWHSKKWHSKKWHQEEGSVTVVMIAIVMVALLVTVWISGLAAVNVSTAQAASGADLAALAGATALQRGHDGCQEASRVAAQNHTRLVWCAQQGPALRVRVECPVSGWFGQKTASGQARAGPAWLLGAD